MKFFDDKGKEAVCLGCQNEVSGILIEGFFTDKEATYYLRERFFCIKHRPLIYDTPVTEFHRIATITYSFYGAHMWELVNIR